MGIAQKNNAQLYEHNGLTSTAHELLVGVTSYTYIFGSVTQVAMSIVSFVYL